MNKQELRKTIQLRLDQQRDHFNGWNHDLSKNLKSLITELLNQGVGQTLGGYVPFKDEPIWFEHFTDEGLSYALVHMHDSLKLSYHQVSLTSVKAKEHNLKLCSDILKNEVEPSFILVPGLAFTRKGERLGRGKAYFDSYLANYKGVKIGIFYALQEVETVYSEGHDEKLDFIVTEKEIIRGI